MSVERTYRLPDRRTGTVLLGFTVPQLLYAAAAVAVVVLAPVLTRSGVGVVFGLMVAAVCGLLGFAPIGGQPAYRSLPSLLAALPSRLGSGRRGWLAPLPLLTGTPTRQGSRAVRDRVPRCLAGLELLAVERPEWAGRRGTAAPVGLVADRRAGTLTAVVGVRGSGFSLLDPPDQHRRLASWAQVLSQFARERSPVTRLGWSLWSSSDTPSHPSQAVSAPTDRVAADRAEYDRLAAEIGVGLMRHELRVWLTVDPRRAGGGDLPELALAAAQALTDRCTAAGLACSDPLSPVQLAEAIRVQADPAAAPALAAFGGGLAERAGLASHLAAAAGDRPDLTSAAPLAVRSDWTSARVDGAWHRVFWVAGWPVGWLPPGWWEPLLHASGGGTRTLATLVEPIGARASRRRINTESVSIDGQLRLREKHAFRVPVGLQQAHADVDEREAELNAGYPECAYLALVCVTAPSRGELESACQATLDAAARCGIVELRPLHGRHDRAWACTLPIGRVPEREMLGGAAS